MASPIGGKLNPVPLNNMNSEVEQILRAPQGSIDLLVQLKDGRLATMSKDDVRKNDITSDDTLWKKLNPESLNKMNSKIEQAPKESPILWLIEMRGGFKLATGSDDGITNVWKLYLEVRHQVLGEKLGTVKQTSEGLVNPIRRLLRCSDGKLATEFEDGNSKIWSFAYEAPYPIGGEQQMLVPEVLKRTCEDCWVCDSRHGEKLDEKN